MEPADAQWVIQTKISKVWLGSDNIIYYTYTVPNAEETLEDAKEAHAQIKAKAMGKRYPILVDLTGIKSVSNEAKAYHASPEAAEVLSAGAMLVTNPIAEVLGSLFIGLNKPPVPVKLFLNRDEALKWLKNYTP